MTNAGRPGRSWAAMLAAGLMLLAGACGGRRSSGDPDSGANNNNDNEPECGNGSLEAPEECDASALGGATCMSLSLGSGDLACTALCTFDVSGCSEQAECGNGELEYPETCDGTDVGIASCASLGFAGGELGCDADCGFDTSQCHACGNGVIDTPEQCDGASLGGATCGSLGLGTGDLVCTLTCTFDTTGCSIQPQCNDGVAQGGELCDTLDLRDQTCALLGYVTGTLACTNDCTWDLSGCQWCGNGIAEGGEDCDGVDLDEMECTNLGFDGGTLACANDCVWVLSGCIDCPPQETFCNGACVDTLTSQDHCGSCNPCGAGTVCVGGICRSELLPWVDVDPNPIGGNGMNVTAHDLGTDGTWPTVAFVEDMGDGNRLVHASEHDGATWSELLPSPSGVAWIRDTVALAFSGTTPFVAYSGGAGSPGSVHVTSYQGALWQEIGAPGYVSACMSHMFIDLALDGTTPHLTTMGAGGCGVGIDYSWFDGLTWQVHPSTTFPGQLTMNGQGNPAIVYTDQAYIGLPDRDPVGSITIHTVEHWDSIAAAWADLGGELDMNLATSWQEHIALVADGSRNLYAAWVESDGGVPATNDVYVKLFSVAQAAWTLVGPGQINGPGSSTLPSITLIGAVPWVAYVETANTGTDLIMVRRYDTTLSSWELVGQPLNVNLAANATAPVIVGIGGVPFVAFREAGPAPGTWRLYVKAFQ